MCPHLRQVLYFPIAAQEGELAFIYKDINLKDLPSPHPNQNLCWLPALSDRERSEPGEREEGLVRVRLGET